MLYILPFNVCASNFLFNKSNSILPSKGSERNGCLGIDADMVSPPKALGRIEGIILDTVLAPRTSTIAISNCPALSISKKNLKLGLWCCWQWGSWCGFWPRGRGIWVEDQCQWVRAWDGHFSEHKGEILLKLGFCWEKEEVGFLLLLFGLKSLRGWFLWIKRDIVQGFFRVRVLQGFWGRGGEGEWREFWEICGCDCLKAHMKRRGFLIRRTIHVICWSHRRE